jgi:hypothetical protein
MKDGLRRFNTQFKRVGTAVAVVCAIVAFLACGEPPAIVQKSSAPASQLVLTLAFSNALIPSDHVTIKISIFDAADNNHQVQLTQGQHLTVNGVAVDTANPPKLFEDYTLTVPRAPLGGNYTLDYTDERGQQTTVVIPAAQRDLAITSPAVNASVPIPQPTAGDPPSMTIHFTPPFDEAVPISKQDYRPPYEGNVFGACKSTTYQGTPATYARCALVGATEPSGTDGVIAKENANDPPAFRFSNIAPGPGVVSVDAHVSLLIPSSGFHALTVNFTDETSIPITWV